MKLIPLRHGDIFKHGGMFRVYLANYSFIDSDTTFSCYNLNLSLKYGGDYKYRDEEEKFVCNLMDIVKESEG